jgi:hypothetical protein
MGHELRQALAVSTQGLTDRLEVERAGFQAFVAFSVRKENLYKVVMQSQFVDESIYRDYYQTLADAYAAGLRQAQDDGQIREGCPETQAWALMGIAHFLGLRYSIWERCEPPREAMETVFDFVAHGLSRKSQNT